MKPVLAPTEWMNRRSWPRDVDDQRLAGGEPGIDLEGGCVDLVGPQGLGGEPAEDIVADAGADRGRARPAGQGRPPCWRPRRRYSRPARRPRPARRLGQVVQRRAEMVGHHEARADDRGRGRAWQGSTGHGGSSRAVNGYVDGEAQIPTAPDRRTMLRRFAAARSRRIIDRCDDLVASQPCPTVSGSSVGRLPISSSISATDRTSRSIRASVRRSSSSRCSSRRR